MSISSIRRNAPIEIERPNEELNIHEITGRLEARHPDLAPFEFDRKHRVGCGAFGCIFLTANPNIYVKLTADQFEVPGAQALIETRKDWPGLIKVFAVYKMQQFMAHDPVGAPVDPRGDESGVGVLFTERVGTFGSRDEMNTEGIAFMNTVVKLGGMKELAYREMVHLQSSGIGEVFDGAPNGDSFWAEWIDRMFYGPLKQVNGLKDMRDTYKKLWDNYRIVFPDIHPGNIGFRITQWSAKLRPKAGTFKNVHGKLFHGHQLLCLDLGVSGGSGLQTAAPATELLAPESSHRQLSLDFGKRRRKTRLKKSKLELPEGEVAEEQRIEPFDVEVPIEEEARLEPFIELDYDKAKAERGAELLARAAKYGENIFSNPARLRYLWNRVPEL